MCVFANKLGSVRGKEGMRSPFDAGVERARKGRKKKQMCQWALSATDTKANPSGAGAHFRLVISVVLRMAASGVVPSAPMYRRCCVRRRGVHRSRARRRRTRCCSA